MSKGFWFVVGAIVGVVAYRFKNTYDEIKEAITDTDGNIKEAVEEYFRDAREGGAAAVRAATAKKCEETQPQNAAQESKPATPVHESEHTPKPESKPAATTAEPEQPVATPESLLESDDKPESELQPRPESKPKPESGNKTDSE